jgi:hypothetical protein
MMNLRDKIILVLTERQRQGPISETLPMVGTFTDSEFVSGWERTFSYEQKPLPYKPVLKETLLSLSDDDLIHLYTNVCLEAFK